MRFLVEHLRHMDVVRLSLFSDGQVHTQLPAGGLPANPKLGCSPLWLHWLLLETARSRHTRLHTLCCRTPPLHAAVRPLNRRQPHAGARGYCARTAATGGCS